MPFKRRCMTCGSKQWHKEPSSGMIACSEGHVLQSYRNESKEADVIGPHVMQKRSLKSTRKKRESLSHANPQLYHGARGRYLYFQCLQTILRLQISTLAKLWSLPAAFEVICRDVWALNLCLLPNPIHGDADGMHITEEVDREPIPADADKTDPFDQDAEIDQLLRENSESSDDSGDEESSRIPVAERKPKGVPPEEGPASTVAVLVVTCWLLRIPVMYQDFARIIEAYELPYLDSVRLLPGAMTSHLTKHVIQSLSPHHAPKTLALHAISSRLAKKLCSKYGIMVPEINAAPLLWRAVRSYKGTPTLYALAKRLMQVLPVSLFLHPSAVPNTSDMNYEKNGRAIVPIEVTFVAIIIMVLKMTYGLDGTARVPRVPNDPACSLPLGEDYVENLRSEEKGDTMTKFDSRKALSIGDLDDDDVDEYLQFCAHALLGADRPPDNELLDTWFPLEEKTHTGEPAGRTDRQNQGQGTMKATSARIGGENLVPGMKYTIWNGRDVCGEVPREYWEVVCLGAAWAGVDDDYLCQVVERYEQRLLSWWRREALAA